MTDTSITAENLAEDRGLKVRQSFLMHPGEASEVDYKAAVTFVASDSFSLKLVKHILGMANAGGGYLVIGYPENDSKHPEAGTVNKEILASYDVSVVASVVEKYKSGTEKIDIKIHKDEHPTNDQIYPIIEIGSFKTRPFFCKSSAGGILEESALYIRVAGARTIKVATPDEWDQLIDICVSKKQDDTLKRFADLLKGVGINLSNPISDTGSKKNMSEWVSEIRRDAQKEVEKAGLKFEGMEVIHSLESFDKTLDIKTLLAVMQAAILRNTGWPIAHVFQTPEYKPQPYKKGLRSIVAPSNKESFDYWFIDEKGSFYFFRAYQEDWRNILAEDENSKEKRREIWFDTNIWRIAEALEHAVALYKAIDVEGTSKLNLAINFFGIQVRTLCASPGTSRHLFPRISGVSTSNYEWTKEISLDALNTTIDQNVIEITNGLFVMFDFMELQPNVIQGIIDEYRGSSVRHA